MRINSKARKFWTFARGVFEYNVLARFGPLAPKEMIINLTYWCNSRCVMCNIWKMRPKNELSFPEWQKIMNDPIFKNIEVLTLSGGEATLHPELTKLAELFVNSMPKLYSLSIITNGFMTDFIVKKVAELAELCKKRKIHLSVSVSIDGINKMHEVVRKIPNAFKKSSDTLLALKKLQKQYDFSLGSGSLIFRKNLSETETVEKWFKKNKLSLSFQIIGFHETFVNNLETQNNLDFTTDQKDELGKVLKNLAKGRSWNNLRSYYWVDLWNMYMKGKPRTTPCPFLVDQFVLDSFGDVYYCLSERKIGNCRERKSVSDIYYHPKNLGFRKNLPNFACKKCNSGCNVGYAIAKDFKKFAWFKLTGRLWYG
jgi:MoaA/NifB/PqqE/SkfB family radical SAM enzyme